MVKYSKDTTHEMIELGDMYDLRFARLITGQINSIDGANNCANVTVVNPCEEMAGVDLTAVKFFYHCENSSGTVEDLAMGYKAFKPEEYVAMLWIPERAGVDERFFIVEHVDIRGTKRCLTTEILIIRAKGNTASGDMYCLFDTSTGAILDTENFVPLDENSPAYPPAIGVWSSSVWAWIWYNFRYVDRLTTVTVPLTCSVIYPNHTLNWQAPTSSVTAYTGTQGYTFGSNPIDCEAWFDEGNGIYQATANRVAPGVVADSISGTQQMTISMDSPFGTHAGLGDNDCDTAWGHTSYTNTVNVVCGSKVYGVRMWCPVSSAEYFVKLGFESKQTSSNDTTLADGVFYAEADHSWSYKLWADFSSIAPQSERFTLSSSCSRSYQLNAWPPYSGTVEVSALSESGNVVVGYDSDGEFIRPDTTSKSDGNVYPVSIGVNNVYFVYCATAFYKTYTSTGHLFKAWANYYNKTLYKQPDGLALSPSVPYGRGNGLGTQWAGEWYNSYGEIIASTTAVGHFKVVPCAAIAPVSASDSGDMAFSTVLSRSDSTKAKNLSLAIAEMYQQFDNRLQTLGFNADAVLSFYNAYILLGPTVAPMIKRTA